MSNAQATPAPTPGVTRQPQWWPGQVVTAFRSHNESITLDRDCPYRQQRCGDQCALFEWLAPNADHRRYRVKLHCCGRTMSVRQESHSQAAKEDGHE